MLTGVDPKQVMSRADYKSTLRPLEDQLSSLQQRVRDAGLPVVILFEGWGAAGKGTQISRLVNPLDPRYFDVRTTAKVTEDKAMRPFLWSFWTYLPPKGQIVIMDKSWHRMILPGVRDMWGLTNMEAHGFHYDVNAFERQLVEGGYLIIKLFLHISREEQANRFAEFSANPNTAWRVDEYDLDQNEKYDINLRLFEKLLRMTHSEQSPWHVIEADDKRFATCKMMRIIIDALSARLDKAEEVAPQPVPTTPLVQHTLRNVSPDWDIEQAEYKKQLAYYQARMSMLGNKMFSKRRSAVVVYEGWDAAGKGGNIKRLTSELDPRCYTVVPIGPPRPQEFSRHYLWRFMVKMPKDGHLTIFDRSWYGRVLVERVEGLTPDHIWQRSYHEINEMEQHLVGHGVVILKFFLHIDQDEQLRRFEGRLADPLKQHKITEDDWRNREKWDLYEAAVDEMLLKTHTSHAPWIVVESNSKKFARIKVLQTVTDALEDAMQ